MFPDRYDNLEESRDVRQITGEWTARVKGMSGVPILIGKEWESKKGMKVEEEMSWN